MAVTIATNILNSQNGLQIQAVQYLARRPTVARWTRLNCLMITAVVLMFKAVSGSLILAGDRYITGAAT